MSEHYFNITEAEVVQRIDRRIREAFGEAADTAVGDSLEKIATDFPELLGPVGTQKP